MRILVTYLPDDRLTDVPTISIDIDKGVIDVRDKIVSACLYMKLCGLAFKLLSIYEGLNEEKDKC